ncbi:MAG: UvrD-helicase domain-containing protein [Gemmatimonadaceae bacterium]
MPHTPSDSQRLVIEAEPGALLVFAGPGAGKTYCLIERIRFLVEKRGLNPARICAFTFTNKAAEEISSRLETYLGSQAGKIKRGTIHSFCAELLREFTAEAELRPGFGIADEEYQLRALYRVEGYSRWHRKRVKQFTAYRFCAEPLHENDRGVYDRYLAFLEKRNMVDFDMLVLKTSELLRNEEVAAAVRQRWDCILVDEFQDLNTVQYSIMRSLALEHGNVFAVGDDEQSIYSWAGADPRVFGDFLNDFGLSTRLQLGENRRCPSEVITLSRRLVNINTPMFGDRRFADSGRHSPFPVEAMTFGDEREELAWIFDDLRRDREAHTLEWGDYALLYRTHEIGHTAESAFLAAGIPCRMAQGHALADDPVVRYLVAALRVISNAEDPIHRERFLQVVLPRPLFDSARAKADEAGSDLLQYFEQRARRQTTADADRSKIWKGLFALKNLAALGASHSSLSGLVDELLSQRVGEYRTVLEDNHDELSDPAENEEVQLLAARLRDALDFGKTVWIPRLGGLEIALKGMLAGIDLNRVQLGGYPEAGAVSIGHSDCKSLGIALGLFKAAQLARSAGFSNHFLDFTAVDLETTGKDIAQAEVVEIAAVKVRKGHVEDEFHSLVKPRVPITEGAFAVHGISAGDVAESPFFEEVWPQFREFCGPDIFVAHNGYQFDFPILRRMAESLSGSDFCTYDTLVLARELHSGSARLVDLARYYGIETGQSHRALDDTKALARLFLVLGEAKIVRARKTALIELLGPLGLALALSDESLLCDEARRMVGFTRVFALGRNSNCLTFYQAEAEACSDAYVTTLADLIELLGGETVMSRIRADKTAVERYPEVMLRLKPLLDVFEGQPMPEQLAGFLERVALSKKDGTEGDSARVNLLTLHSTKGLEFSRVYIVGAEDAELLGERDPDTRQIEEARRLLYVGMTRTKDRLVFTRVEARAGKPTGGHQFLDEMGLTPVRPK